MDNLYGKVYTEKDWMRIKVWYTNIIHSLTLRHLASKLPKTTTQSISVNKWEEFCFKLCLYPVINSPLVRQCKSVYLLLLRLKSSWTNKQVV